MNLPVTGSVTDDEQVCLFVQIWWTMLSTYTRTAICLKLLPTLVSRVSQTECDSCVCRYECTQGICQSLFGIL